MQPKFDFKLHISRHLWFYGIYPDCRLDLRVGGRENCTYTASREKNEQLVLYLPC